MKRIQHYLVFAVLVLFAPGLHAQTYYQVTNFSGTSTYGGIGVTVTSSGSVSTGGGQCFSNPVPYWAGQVGGGQYTFSFSQPVGTVEVFCEGLNPGEYCQIYINGQVFCVTPCNVVCSYTIMCGGGGNLGFNQNCLYYGPNNLYGGGEMLFPYGNINTFELYCNGTLSGTDFWVKFSPTVNYNQCATCFNASNNGPICSGDSLKLSVFDPNGLSYQWTGPNGFNTTVQDPAIPNATLANAGIYTVVVTTQGGHDTAYTTAVVNPRPVLSATSNAPVCSGNTLSLSGASNPTANGYWWTGPNGFISNIQNPSISNVVVPDGGQYMVWDSLNGCRDSMLLNVVVNQTPPTPSIGSNQPICSGGTLLLNSGSTMPGVAYHWQGPNNFASNLQNPTLNGVSAAAYGSYTVTTTINGCSSDTSILISVGQTPDVPVIQSNTPLCSGNILSLSAISTAGATYSWTGPQGFTSASQDNTIPNVQVVNGGVYNVIATFDGCTSQSSATLIIKQTPLPPPVTSVQYCQYDVAAPMIAYGESILWYTTPTGGTGLSATPVPSTQNTDSLVWFASQTVNGCESDRTPVSAEVNYKANYSIVTDSAICLGTQATFTYTGTSDPVGADTYQWKTLGTEKVISGLSTTALTVKFDSIGIHKLYLTVTDAKGLCPSLDSASIYVAPTPTVDMAFPKDACAESNITITNTYNSQDLATYNWNFDGATVISGSPTSSDPYVVSYPNEGTYYPSVTAQSKYGCPAVSVQDTVIIHGAPQAQILNDNDTTVCTNSAIKFTSGIYTTGNNYAWTPEKFFGTGNTGDTAIGIISSSGDVTLTVTNPFGCTATAKRTFATESCCNVTFPTAFTPNSGTQNNIFKPITIGHNSVKEFIVKNRWGQTIYNSAGTGGWDGTFNGVPQDIGVYYWYIKFECTSGGLTEEKGEVTLIR